MPLTCKELGLILWKIKIILKPQLPRRLPFYRHLHSPSNLPFDQNPRTLLERVLCLPSANTPLIPHALSLKTAPHRHRPHTNERPRLSACDLATTSLQSWLPATKVLKIFKTVCAFSSARDLGFCDASCGASQRDLPLHLRLLLTFEIRPDRI